MCTGSGETEDPIASVLGAFDGSNDDFTMEKAETQIIEVLQNKIFTDCSDDSILKVAVCTAPFILCTIMAEFVKTCKNVHLLAYLGLPPLWKGPVDFHDNAKARERYFELGHAFLKNKRGLLSPNFKKMITSGCQAEPLQCFSLFRSMIVVGF